MSCMATHTPAPQHMRWDGSDSDLIDDCQHGVFDWPGREAPARPHARTHPSARLDSCHPYDCMHALSCRAGGGGVVLVMLRTHVCAYAPGLGSSCFKHPSTYIFIDPPMLRVLHSSSSSIQELAVPLRSSSRQARTHMRHPFLAACARMAPCQALPVLRGLLTERPARCNYGCGSRSACSWTSRRLLPPSLIYSTVPAPVRQWRECSMHSQQLLPLAIMLALAAPVYVQSRGSQ